LSVVPVNAVSGGVFLRIVGTCGRPIHSSSSGEYVFFRTALAGVSFGPGSEAMHTNTNSGHSN
jgi:hypothetical protein